MSHEIRLFRYNEEIARISTDLVPIPERYLTVAKVWLHKPQDWGAGRVSQNDDTVVFWVKNIDVVCGYDRHYYKVQVV